MQTAFEIDHSRRAIYCLHGWSCGDLLPGLSNNNVRIVSRIAHEYLNFGGLHVTRNLGLLVQNEFQSDITTLVHVTAQNNLRNKNQVNMAAKMEKAR